MWLSYTMRPRTCHVYVHWHRYFLLRDELRILSKRLAFTGNLSCFKKCTYCLANGENDLRNAPKCLRKTVIHMSYARLMPIMRKFFVILVQLATVNWTSLQKKKKVYIFKLPDMSSSQQNGTVFFFISGPQQVSTVHSICDR